MDPLSALSIAAAVAQFAEFGFKLVRNTHEIYKSSSGQPAKTINLTTVSKDLQSLAGDVDQKIGDAQGTSAVVFRRLCQECASVHNELAGIIEAIRKKDANGGKVTMAVESFAIALQHASRAGQIEELASRLADVRQQMTVALLGLLLGESQRNGVEFRQFVRQQTDSLQILDRIDQTTKSFSANLVAFVDGKSQQQRSDVDEMVSYVLSDRWSPSDYLEVNRHGVDEQRDGECMEAIYKSLFFTSMSHREGGIPARFATTFEWMFREPRQSETGEPMWTDFPKWLESDAKEIYWVTGKPGSGKSTLIKFVANDPRLEEHLQVWAAGAELVTARFFSWNAGMDPLQRTHQGLYRTLLFEILKKKPQLIPQAFPGRWFLLQSFGNNAKLPPVSERDLARGFTSLLNLPEKNFKFALLIDGLDEFTDDHRKLVTLLCEVNKSEQVKICSSSRPWNVFKDAYAQNPTLQLEYLTLDDLRLFIESKLKMSPGYQEFADTKPHEAAQITADLVGKAHGVFLWVSVISGLLETSFQEGAKTKELRAIIDGLPEEISELFQYIWKRTSPGFRVEASRYFQMAKLCRDYGVVFYSLTLWFGEADISATMTASDLTDRYVPSAHKSVERMLMSRTGGLLELFEDQETGDAWKIRVDYMHRTASDWVQENWDSIRTATDGVFDPNLWLMKGEVLRALLDPDWNPLLQEVRGIFNAARNVLDREESDVVLCLLDRFDQHMAKIHPNQYWGQAFFPHLSRPAYVALLEITRQDLEPCVDMVGFAARVSVPVYLKRAAVHRVEKLRAACIESDIIKALVIGELWIPDQHQRLDTLKLLLGMGIKPHNPAKLSARATEAWNILTEADWSETLEVARFFLEVIRLLPLDATDSREPASEKSSVKTESKSLFGIKRRFQSVRNVLGRRK